MSKRFLLPLAAALTDLDAERVGAFARVGAELRRLAGLSSLELNPGSVASGSICDVAGGVNLAIVLPEGALGEAEQARLGSELAQVEGELDKLQARLADATFAARAPEEVVAGARARAAELVHKRAMLAATLGRGR